MKNNTAIFIHNKLTELYSSAEEVFASFKAVPNFEASYGFFDGHYMKINNRYECQRYPIPVISVENKGDIGFNLSEIWFEFFLDKEDFNSASISDLINKYEVEIYGGEHCLLDFYKPGKPLSDVFDNVNNSSETTIGVGVYLKEDEQYNVKDTFLNVCNLLKI